ncbi:hypothetical protein BC7_00045 [Bacillus phage BC-7]|nr:hypothetical protein BC7_00045 [Bacillus phage BC-7]
MNSFREGYDTVYYLNREGRDYVDAKRQLRKNQFVQHTLWRNDFFIFKGKPSYWRNEIRVGNSSQSIICDTLFKENGKMYILEVDRTQKMSINKEKAIIYKDLSSKMKDFPTVIWLTGTEHRRKQLIKVCAELGLACKVYTSEDIL